MANSCWWTGSDGRWWSLTVRKTQPAVISKGDHLLINAICSRNSSPSHYSAWQAALSEVRLCFDRWKHCPFQFFVPGGGNSRSPLRGALRIVCVCRYRAVCWFSGAFVWAVNWQSDWHISIQMITVKPLRGGQGPSRWRRELCCALKDHLLYFCGAWGT